MTNLNMTNEQVNATRRMEGASEGVVGLQARGHRLAAEARVVQTSRFTCLGEGSSIYLFMQPSSEATSISSYPNGTTARW